MSYFKACTGDIIKRLLCLMVIYANTEIKILQWQLCRAVYDVLFNSASFDFFRKAIMRQHESKKTHPVHKLCHETQFRSQLHCEMYKMYKMVAEVSENIQVNYKDTPSALQIA